MFQIPLKLKYLVAKQPYKCGAYSGRTGNCHGPTPKYQKSNEGKGVRRKVYLGNISKI